MESGENATTADREECDREVRTISGLEGGEEGQTNEEEDDDDVDRKQEVEIAKAAQVDVPSNTSRMSTTSSPPNSSSSSSEIKLKLESFSGRSSRKDSGCATPISSARITDTGSGSGIDYPSPNFVRRQDENGVNNGNDDDDTKEEKLTIRLHYNPVMDEWVSLTDESIHPRDSKDIDILFDLHKKIDTVNEQDVEMIQIRPFLKALEATGLRRTDPRLKPMMKNLETLKKESFKDEHAENLTLNRNQFKRVVRDSMQLLSRAFKNQFVIPEFGYFCDEIEKLYEECMENNQGNVATYIPQLARYDPNLWGVSICTVDGQRFSIGDTAVPFTMQSSSKPFTYAVCLNELGRETVHNYVGQEPSGRFFNELSLDSNDKPHNPLLNSGAIMSAAILLTLVNPDMKMSEKFDFVSDYIKRIAGGEFLSFNNSVFLSERESADRNYALTYYMKENKCFPGGKNFVLQDCLDFYFQTCSMEVNCESISVLGATLANAGVCPITNEEVLKPEAVRDVLSLMHSCGMYNYSGQFAFNVGLPAKSGVSGALVLVIPNVMGIGLFSPPLDYLGNSVRGVQFAQKLVEQFRFHRFDTLVTHDATKEKIDPRLFKDEYDRQSTLCLLYAATTGDLTALKRFHYNNHMNMDSPNYDGRTALHLACAEGHLSCVRFLLEVCKADALRKDRWEFTPLSEAKRFKHEKVVELINTHLVESQQMIESVQ